MGEGGQILCTSVTAAGLRVGGWGPEAGSTRSGRGYSEKGYQCHEGIDGHGGSRVPPSERHVGPSRRKGVQLF